jgi:hypothetical protein
MIRQESTYNKETGLLTSFTEYINGEMQYHHVYDEYQRLIEFKDNIYNNIRKYNEAGEMIDFQDSLGGFFKLIDTPKNRLEVNCTALFGTFSNNVGLYKALSDNLCNTNKSGTKFHRIKIILKDNLNRYLLEATAYKPQGFSDFYLSQYIENHFFDDYTEQLSFVTHSRKVPNLDNYLCFHRITPLDYSEPQKTNLNLKEFPTRASYIDILKNYDINYSHTGMPL